MRDLGWRLDQHRPGGHDLWRSGWSRLRREKHLKQKMRCARRRLCRVAELCAPWWRSSSASKHDRCVQSVRRRGSRAHPQGKSCLCNRWSELEEHSVGDRAIYVTGIAWFLLHDHARGFWQGHPTIQAIPLSLVDRGPGMAGRMHLGCCATLKPLFVAWVPCALVWASKVYIGLRNLTDTVSVL